MSLEAVKEYFRTLGMEERIVETEQSSATVALAAEALGCEPERIAKSLSFRVDGEPVLIVAAGDAKVNNGKFKRTFGTKPKMLTPEETEEEIGHAVGGVCPFAVKPAVKVYMDRSLNRFETVFPACGSGNSAVELTVDELRSIGNSLGEVDVCKLPGEESL